MPELTWDAVRHLAVFVTAVFIVVVVLNEKDGEK